LAAGFAAASVLGCGGASPSPPPAQTATAAVTPQGGGTVELPDNTVKLDVPPGAVPADTMITMTTTDATAPQGVTAVSPILQFEPDGTVFQKPVTVTFTFKNATNPVVFWSNSTGGYDLIEGTVTGSTIAAPVMHFSKGFVGERPAGSTNTCADGVACSAGMTCGFGGTASSGTSGPTTGGQGGTSTGGGTMSGSASADASVGAPSSGPATDPGSKTSALTSTPPSAAVCCSCGSDGVFHCSLCQGSDVGAPACVEGGACTVPGSGCGSAPGTSGGSGGGTMSGSTSVDASVGAPSGGPVQTDPGSKTSALSSTPSSDDGGVPAGGAPMCCTCGADGHYHCGASCTGPSNGGADASTGTGSGTMGGAADGGVIMSGGGGPPAMCVAGAACQPGSAPCGDASPTSCTMCTCGADGTLSCAPCDVKAQPDGGAMTGGGGQCVQGAACVQGMPECRNASPTSCLACTCGAGGMLECTTCPGFVGMDAGMSGSAPDGGIGGGGPVGCVPGGACTVGTAGCQNAAQGGACMACQCVDPGMYNCAPCGGTQPPPQNDAGAAQPPCGQGLACPQPGTACDAGMLNGVCTKCMCGADGTYACTQAAC
jgi:hypothetical protein